MTTGEYHLLEMIRFYETQAREGATVDFLKDEMALAIRGLHRRVAEVSPNLTSESGKMLLLDTESLIRDNQLDITRRLSILVASQERFQGIENMMQQVDESGQDFTVDFTDDLASGLDVMRDLKSTSNPGKVTSLARSILRYCEEIDKQFVEAFGAQYSS
ncbi:hypothetical protein N7466_003491 [Penicillium verhagenii]|uniref:uncharacterized protein n=1 Tax=Penicillium verhagenii TaxID=1562060 RepID=UPI0025456B91|nr:uncharacterized protein N7466_003491 [Penicillium verhagenii]KAJ5937041.1 hypothetical protein N7466_003491 [Penicillium verhagenii]